MKVRIAKKRKEKLEFILEEASTPFANALRRIMMVEVPVLAIDRITVTENSSPLFDEMLAQRLGLIPLLFDPDKFNFRDQCKCDGKTCPSCQVVFALEKKGPGIAYSGDLKSSNPSVKPTDPGFPVVELLDGQKVTLEATARLGTGKEHARFQAANAVFENHPQAKEEEINTKPDKFLFRVESISGLAPEDIVSKAAEILEEKARAFKKEAADL